VQPHLADAIAELASGSVRLICKDESGWDAVVDSLTN
jgi:hypothetical protein